jgi:hypothetical protein
MKRVILIAASLSLILQSKAASLIDLSYADIDTQVSHEYVNDQSKIQKAFINPVLYKVREFP